MQRLAIDRVTVFATLFLLALAFAGIAAQRIGPAMPGLLLTDPAPIQVAHGPTMPPNPWEGVQVAHGPTMPPNPWEGVQVAHGPTMPPNPWEG
ncbi:MAG: hypothetical protein ABSC23_15770 [Bryobacteraceae bacterium]|jgi:hypothetical protein